MLAAKNRATPDEYFFIPPAKFRETYAADVPAADAQFLADSQQQLAEKALGAPISVAAWRTKPSYAILTTQDHVISPELQRWMRSAPQSAGCISVRAPRSPEVGAKPHCLFLTAGRGRSGDRGCRQSRRSNEQSFRQFFADQCKHKVRCRISFDTRSDTARSA